VGSLALPAWLVRPVTGHAAIAGAVAGYVFSPGMGPRSLFRPAPSLTLAQNAQWGSNNNGGVLLRSTTSASAAEISANVGQLDGLTSGTQFSATWYFRPTNSAYGPNNVGVFAYHTGTASQVGPVALYRSGSTGNLTIDIPWAVNILTTTWTSVFTDGVDYVVTLNRNGSAWSLWVNAGAAFTATDATAFNTSNNHNIYFGYWGAPVPVNGIGADWYWAIIRKASITRETHNALALAPMSWLEPALRRPVLAQVAAGGGTVTGDGASAGAGTATAVGAATAAADASAAGAGAATGVGSFTLAATEGIASAAGSGTATGVGAATAAGVANAAGASDATAVGASIGIVSAVGNAAGSSEALGYSPTALGGGEPGRGGKLGGRRRKRIEWLPPDYDIETGERLPAVDVPATPIRLSKGERKVARLVAQYRGRDDDAAERAAEQLEALHRAQNSELARFIARQQVLDDVRSQRAAVAAEDDEAAVAFMQWLIRQP
jgi:hypothetical protein